MEKTVLSFDDVLHAQIESFLEEDASYEYFATPIKPARYIKAEHLNQLKELFYLKQLKAEFEKGDSLILRLLEKNLTAADFAQVKEEKERSDTHFFKSLAHIDENGPVIFQQLFGYSNETMLHIYACVEKLIKEKLFDDAYSLLVFLTLLAPHVPSYWIAQGLCLQELKRPVEAAASFEAATYLDSANPAPLAYAIESYLEVDEGKKAEVAFKALDSLMESYAETDKGVWMEFIQEYSKKLK